MRCLKFSSTKTRERKAKKQKKVQSNQSNKHSENDKLNTKSCSTLPKQSTWEHNPIFLQADPSVVAIAEHQRQDPSDTLSCPIGAPFEFESDLFQGKALIRIRGLERSRDVTTDNKYFKGRKRKNQVIIQGKFKEEIKCSSVVIGTEFKHGFSTQPPTFLHNLVLSILRRIAPSLVMNLYGDRPKV